MDPVAALAVVNDEGHSLDTRMTAAIDLLEWIAKGGSIEHEGEAIEACVAILHRGLDVIQGVR